MTLPPRKLEESLRWGQCRYVGYDDSHPTCRRRRPRPAEKHELPNGTLLLATPDGLTLCHTQSLLPVIVTDNAVTLCFDEAVQVMLVEVGLKNDSSATSQRALSILASHLLPERFHATCTVANDKIVCPDLSHRHVIVKTTPDPSIELESCFVTSFVQLPATLLSISLVRMNESNETTSSPLGQRCFKRLLVGCHLCFVDNQVTCQISIPFEERQVVFRVASILPTPSKSRPTGSVMYIIMPSTRITIWESKPIACDVPIDDGMAVTSQVSLNMSPAGRELIETIHCIRQSFSTVPRAFLIVGPPGVGKTYSVGLAVRESETQGPTKLVSLRGSELLSTASHPSEAAKALRHQFYKASHFCQMENHVSLIFIDECEALLSSDVVAAMFGNLLDQICSSTDNGWQRIVAVAATNRIDAVPPWLRRPGRLDREIALCPPNVDARLEIIQSLIRKSTLQQVSDNVIGLSEVAEACVGYVAADLAALVRRATLLAIQEGARQITADLLKRAMADVGASALRDAALSAPPKTTWDDIAGDPGGAKTALRRAIEWPRTKKHAYERLGLVPPRGILLHGPPGCAKTSLARAAAGATGIAFFSLSPADIYASSYVGEAEAVVRRAFTLARSAAPCILFFDEIDSILGCSGDNSHGGMGRSAKSAEARVLSTFLNEMDGVDASQDDGVLVLGATNRPNILDAALLRPGRFDSIIYVPPPDEEGRRALLEMQCRGWKCSTDRNDGKKGIPFIDIDLLASEAVTGFMTGAEILGACREAAMRVLRDILEGSLKDNPGGMKQSYLVEALRNVNPLLSNKDLLEEYKRFESRRAAS